MEAERFYEEAQKLGDHAALALGPDRRSQMTELEVIAESALKTSDVFDYIKKQIARSKEGEFWRKTGPDNPATVESQKGLGERLKTYLEKQLFPRLDVVCANVGIAKNEKTMTRADRWKRQEIHLRLIRQFIRQMVVQYEYQTGGSRE